jgi:hypothetical protein
VDSRRITDDEAAILRSWLAGNEVHAIAKARRATFDQVTGVLRQAVSRRTTATMRRPNPHLYQQDPDAPGTCVHCHLIKRNEAHVDQLPAVDPAVVEHEHRRLGERED